ncbi:MAG: dipeptide epimerase [Chloroflexota bacterium]|nr:dipeptide epimerase [Chloroflexota bacterium]
MQKPRLTWEEITLEFHRPFRLSKGISATRRAFWIRLSGDEGWGEGTIPPYYGIEDEEMTTLWSKAAQNEIPFPDNPAKIAAWIGDEGPAPAKCALDLALHDRIAKKQNIPLYRLLGLSKPVPIATAFTIGIASPEEMAKIAAENAQYPVIKLKLGSDDDIARVAAVRSARPDARIYVDANAGWMPEEAVRLAKALAPYHLDMIEQPVAKDDIEGMGYVQANTEIPIVADESVCTLADVEALAKAGIKGINLKLMKIGGLIPALEMLQRGKELGLKIMLGCMSETALGVTAMAHLTAYADWIDLDAPLLIKNNPFKGLRYDEQALIHIPDQAGIGVALIEKCSEGDSKQKKRY